MKNYQQTPKQRRQALEASKTRVNNSLKTQLFKVPGQSKKSLSKGVSLHTLVSKQQPNAYRDLSLMSPMSYNNLFTF
jgi:hypothetical protein